MLLDVTFEELAEVLDDLAPTRRDEVIPARFPPASHSPYRPGYDWLFLYERQLARYLDRWLLPHRFELVGSQGLLSEALSNAFCHGHRRKEDAPIHVTVFVGGRGLVVRIADGGSGFAVPKVLERVAKGRSSYYHNAGNGLRKMMTSAVFGVFFDDGGRAFHLVHCFQGVGALLEPFAWAGGVARPPEMARP